MLVTFSSKSRGDVVMLGKHALEVLKALGRNYETLPEHGVITHEQLAAAIANLERAMHSDKQENPTPSYEEEDRQKENYEDKPHPMQEPVNLARRAFPLLDMMQAAQADPEDSVVWRSSSAW